MALTRFYLLKKIQTKNFEEIIFFGILSDLEISNWVRLERYQTAPLDIAVYGLADCSPIKTLSSYSWGPSLEGPE